MISDLWYKNAVIYSLSVATYMDANGAGMGLPHRPTLEYDHSRDPSSQT